MPNYRYKAADPSGKSVQGRMDALNETDLELCLKHMGLDLVTCRLVGNGSSLFQTKTVTLPDLVMFCFQMEQLSRAGVSLMDGLTDMRDSTPNPQLYEVIGALVTEVKGGKMLSQAMEMHPEVFDRVFVSLIRTGEQTGRMTDVFANLAEILKWQDELFSQSRRLLVYPLFVLLVVFGSVGFLMVYLVPQMSAFLKNMGQELPLQTVILIGLSNFVSNFWTLILALPFLAIAIVTLLLRKSAAARYRLDYIKLHLPGSGTILQKIIMARFSRYFAMMYQAGIPILEAIKTSQSIVANQVIAEGLERVWQQINAGSKMSESFRNQGLFPPMVVRMIRVGESTSGLDTALLNISHFYDRETRKSLDSMLKMLEPVMTVVLGGILGIIMFSVLGPVYDSFNSFKF